MSALELSLSAPEDERPHPPRADVPLWSENYAFVCFDPVCEAGVFIHVGRLPHNPDLWRGTTVALLPGGELSISKSVGLSPDPQLASSGALSLECVEPFERWLLRHEGLAMRSDSESAAAALVVDRPVERLAYELAFEQISPVWDLTDWMRAQQWGHAHIEQAGRFKGRLLAGERSFDLDCTGFRDHTLGPRNFANLNRTCWAHAEFPSGRVFCALRIWSPEDEVVLNRGFAYEDGRMRELDPGEMPTLTGSDASPRDFEVTLGDGEVSISGEVLHALPFMLDEPNDLLAGTDPSRTKTKVIVEAPSRFDWDGEVGYGWLERSRRVDQL